MNWSQLRTVIWLRWRLSQNQFLRGGAVNAVVQIGSMIFGIGLSIAIGLSGVIGGATLLSDASPMVLMFVWDGALIVFLFVWFAEVISEIQRSQSIDLVKLMHLPVALRGIFVMNYIASHLSASMIIFMPGFVGLSLGLVWSRGISMALLLPLVFSIIFMLTAWTYCLRGWLVALMVNPRRRRNVVVALTLSIVMAGQLPNLYFLYQRHSRKATAVMAASGANSVTDANQSGTSHHQNYSPRRNPQIIFTDVPDGWILAHNYVPLLWLPKGAMALAQGNIWPALLGTLGGFLLGAVGLARAYYSTMRFYLGQDKTASFKPALQISAPLPGRSRKNFLEKQVPWVSEEVAALSLAFFRSMTRAPEVKMALFTNLIVLVALVPVIYFNGFKNAGEIARTFFGTGAVVLTFFGLIPQMTNLFGFDRDGFRALILSPARRRDVLMAKNLALFPIAMVLGLALLSALAIAAHLPFLQLAAGLCKVLAVFLLLSIFGNLMSIWLPYRVTAGSLKPTKPPAKTAFLIVVTQLLFPIAMIPIFIPPLLGLISSRFGGWSAPVVDFLASLLLVGVGAALYPLSLGSLGDMLERREQKILLAVCKEVE